MPTSDFYETLEARLAPFVGFTTLGAIVLNLFGYLSVRFRLRALGIDPDLGLLSEIYLFEGVSLFFFLVELVPIMLSLVVVVVATHTLIQRLPGGRNLAKAFGDRFRALPPIWIATFGTIWAVVTTRFLLRQIRLYRDVIHNGVPCEPKWLASVAGTDGWALLLVFVGLWLVPLPTAWASTRLVSQPAWRTAGVLFVFVAILQILVIPIYYGVLVGNDSMPQLIPTADEPETRMWEIFTSSDRYFLLVVDDGPPIRRTIRTISISEAGPISIESMDSMYDVLTEGRICP